MRHVRFALALLVTLFWTGAALALAVGLALAARNVLTGTVPVPDGLAPAVGLALAAGAGLFAVATGAGLIFRTRDDIRAYRVALRRGSVWAR